MPRPNLTLRGDALDDAWREVWSAYLREEVTQAHLTDQPLTMTATWLGRHMAGIEATLDTDPSTAHEACLRTLEERILEHDQATKNHNGLAAPWPLIRQDMDAREMKLTSLTAEWANKLVAIKGSVSTAGPLLEHALTITYECLRCGHEVTIDQPILPWEAREPAGCKMCEKKSKFAAKHHDGLINYRKARLAPRVGEGTGMVDQRPLLLLGPLARGVMPGEEVTVHGYTVLIEEDDGYRQVVIATDLERQTARDRDHASKADLDAWRGLIDTHGDDFAMRIAEAITPHHYGDHEARLSMAMSLFSRKELGTNDRDAIHVLLVGDPSTGKSRLLRRVAEIMPKGLHVNAKQATRAGLTATVARDKEMGGHRLEPGAFVLASGGTCFIDELDKAPDGELTALHEAMAQLTVSISMAGNTTTLPAHASVIAAANPTNLRWDHNEPLAEQIDLPATILSRFDAIHLFADQPDEDKDREIAAKVLADTHEAAHGISQDLVARVAWTLSNEHDVELPQRVRDHLEDRFVEIRKDHSNSRIPMGQRQLAAMRRFTIAHARMHLRDEATVYDAQWAAAHVETWVQRIARDSISQVDIDFVEAPKAASQKQRVRLVLDTIREHGPVSTEALADRLDWDTYTVRQTVDMLNRQGDLYRPDEEGWRVVE